MPRKSIVFSNEGARVKGLTYTYVSPRADSLYHELERVDAQPDESAVTKYAQIYRFGAEILFIVSRTRSVKSKTRVVMSIKCPEGDEDDVCKEFSYWIEFFWFYRTNTKLLGESKSRRNIAKTTQEMILSRGFEIFTRSEKSEFDPTNLHYLDELLRRD